MTPYRTPQFQHGMDTPRQQKIVKDMSKGMNSRVNNTEIEDTQGENLSNIDVSAPGKSIKSPGSVQLTTTASWGTDPVFVHSFIIQGADDQLFALEDDTLHKWVSGASFSSVSTAFTSALDVGYLNAKQSGIAPDDICLIQNMQGDQFVVLADGTTTDISTGTNRPQETTVMEWYNNRVWTLLNDELEFSDAYPSDYAEAFNNTKFRVPVGEERAIIATRTFGLVIGGENQIWGLTPSITPSAATDQPFPIVQDRGVVSKKAMIDYADDVFWFANDGLRSLKRNEQDKLQQQASYPISYTLKTEFEEILWSRINEVELVGWDNKIFCKVPVVGGFKTWIHYPAYNSWVVKDGWDNGSMTVHKVDGEDLLYYGTSATGKVYRGWYGYSDEGTTTTNGTAITMTEDGKNHDFGAPMNEKYGGEIELKALSVSGTNVIEVWASFDDAEFTKLGELDIEQLSGASFGSAGTSKVTFPVNFSDTVMVRGKFHLDSYGRFRTIQLRLIHDTIASSDIAIIERNIVTFMQDYLME